MKIDKALLIKKIVELKEFKNISYRQMSIESGVNNISRIVSGEIKMPTIDSWWNLHNAYPKDIPEPVYIDGQRVYKNVVQGNVKGSAHQADTMTINNELAQDDNKLTPEELTLIRLIRTKEKPVELTIELIAQVATSK